MNSIEWVNSVNGKPWSDRATGPNAFDCWGLVIDYFRRVHKLQLETVDGYEEGANVEDAASNEISTGRWIETDEPERDCVFVIESESGYVKHVGIIVNINRVGLYAVHSKAEGSQVMANRIAAMQKLHSDKIKYYKRAE